MTGIKHIALIILWLQGTFTILNAERFNGVPPRVYIRACLYGYAVSDVYSTFDRSVRDRDWHVNCKPLGTVPGSDRCIWTYGLVNDYHGRIHFKCGRDLRQRDGFISSLYSHHNGDYSRHGDRRWRFECCQTKGVQLTGCRDTGWINSPTKPLNYTVPPGRVLHGISSAFDRRSGWQIL